MPHFWMRERRPTQLYADTVDLSQQNGLTPYAVRRIYTYIQGGAMAKPRSGKRAALACDGALNPHPAAVRDSLFVDNPFFDPADLVRVRYEMVRRHEVDGQSVSEVAANFGVSRPTFYKAEEALASAGLAGLLPARR